MLLKILVFLFIVPGFLTVYLSGWAVRKYNLDKNVTINFEDTLSEEELTKYKFNAASVRVKMIGIAIALPGIILLLFVFR